jgi:hypothetical protein
MAQGTPDQEPYCLSPHLRGRAFISVTTIHPHSDGSWWFWNPDGMIEQGPFASQMLAEEICRSFSSQVEKPAVKSDFKWALIAMLAVICWLLAVVYKNL